MISRHYARSSKTIIAESAAELKRLRQDLDYTAQQIASSQRVIEETLRTLQSSRTLHENGPARTFPDPPASNALCKEDDSRGCELVAIFEASNLIKIFLRMHRMS